MLAHPSQAKPTTLQICLVQKIPLPLSFFVACPPRKKITIPKESQYSDCWRCQSLFGVNFVIYIALSWHIRLSSALSKWRTDRSTHTRARAQWESGRRSRQRLVHTNSNTNTIIYHYNLYSLTWTFIRGSQPFFTSRLPHVHNNISMPPPHTMFTQIF